MKKKVNEKEGSKKYKNEREDKIKGLWKNMKKRTYEYKKKE
jgi:hypothetical protein